MPEKNEHRPAWKKPPDDFTVYFKFSVLEKLLGLEEADDPNQIADLPERMDKPASVPPTEQISAPLPDAASAPNKRRYGDGTVPLAYDQIVHFLWPLALSAGHILGDESVHNAPALVLIYRARCLACPCYDRGLCSITLRVDDEAGPLVALRDEAGFISATLEFESQSEGRITWNVRTAERFIVKQSIGEVKPESLLQDDWKYAAREELKAPAPVESPDSGKRAGKYLFSKGEIVQALFPAIFLPESESQTGVTAKVIKHGLVIVSGQTGTLKSQVVRGLLDQYLRRFNFGAWGKQRYPHILTFEDPIERPIVPLDRSQIPAYLDHAKTSSVNFTPREIGKDRDVVSLHQGLKDALRQTPAAVIVGETREREDWLELLRFASTGHLCFTTTHAGSLVETMRTIIEATQSTTPDLRSSLVEKIIAVVHLRSFDLVQPTPGAMPPSSPDLNGLSSMLLPAIWRNVNGGANFFVSDGLSAILPRRAEGNQGRTPASCRGRSDFARALMQSSRHKHVEDHVARIAMKSDLEGV